MFIWLFVIFVCLFVIESKDIKYSKFSNLYSLDGFVRDDILIEDSNWGSRMRREPIFVRQEAWQSSHHMTVTEKFPLDVAWQQSVVITGDIVPYCRMAEDGSEIMVSPDDPAHPQYELGKEMTIMRLKQNMAALQYALYYNGMYDAVARGLYFDCNFETMKDVPDLTTYMRQVGPGRFKPCYNNIIKDTLKVIPEMLVETMPFTSYPGYMTKYPVQCYGLFHGSHGMLRKIRSFVFIYF